MTIKTTIRRAITMNSLILVRTRVWLFFFGRPKSFSIMNKVEIIQRRNGCKNGSNKGGNRSEPNDYRQPQP